MWCDMCVWSKPPPPAGQGGTGPGVEMGASMGTTVPPRDHGDHPAKDHWGMVWYGGGGTGATL